MKHWFNIWQASRQLERYLTQWPVGKSRWRDARLPMKGAEVHARLTVPPRTTSWVIAARPEDGPVGGWLLNWAGLATLRVDLQGQAPAETEPLGERLLEATAWLRAQPEYAGQPLGYLAMYD
jgi:hypothetical protein